MQESFTNKICDLKATARCRGDEAAQAGRKETKIEECLSVGKTKIHTWLSGEMRAPHLIATRFVL